MVETKMYVDALVNALEEVADVKLVWNKGFANQGGPHRRLVGNKAPISIGEDECDLFAKLISTMRPDNCFIVGNAFGFSSAFIAMVMQDHGGRSVISLDAQTEGDGERNARVARALADRLRLNLLTNKKGYSPRDVPGAVEDKSYDLIFLDGNHDHPAVTHDLIGALPYAHDKSIIVLHDFWLPGVLYGARAAEAAGFYCWLVRTSCEIVLCTRDKATYEQLRQLFPQGLPNVTEHYRPLKYGVRYVSTTPTRIAFAALEKVGMLALGAMEFANAKRD